MMYGYEFSPLGGQGMHGYYGLGGWLILVGFGLLIVIGLVLWFVYANRNHARSQIATHSGYAPVALSAPAAPIAPINTAETIVRERFARGEIDRDEYDRLMVALRR